MTPGSCSFGGSGGVDVDFENSIVAPGPSLQVTPTLLCVRGSLGTEEVASRWMFLTHQKTWT